MVLNLLSVKSNGTKHDTRLDEVNILITSLPVFDDVTFSGI